MASMTMILGFKCRICSHTWHQFVKMVIEQINADLIGVAAPDNVECPKCGCDAGDVNDGMSNDVLEAV